MDREEEIEHLTKRRNELRTMSCNLQDLQDWFRINDLRMGSIVPYEELGDAGDSIDVVISGINNALGELEIIENE